MTIRKRVLCDTNLLLDVFDVRREFHDDAIALLWYSVESAMDVELIASITSFKDAYYVLTRLYRNELEARESIKGVMNVFVRPVDLLGSYGAEALESGEPDFEDALISVCADHEGASAIITRDKRAFAQCGIPSMNAAEFLEREGFDYSAIDW